MINKYIFTSVPSHIKSVNLKMSSLKILLLSIFIGFGSSQLSFRAPSSCETLTGSKCVFPFTYQDQTYYECTR